MELWGPYKWPHKWQVDGSFDDFPFELGEQRTRLWRLDSGIYNPDTYDILCICNTLPLTRPAAPPIRGSVPLPEFQDHSAIGIFEWFVFRIFRS